ncbi:efflux transporter, RND family, MFP subunit [Desulfovibrio sp. X2]|uniref:efflux RND transporter periplasmic adaptor subunit n=1 Tax=Desulfovibrio sp. X2 TaxID=941449 RepID=UPI000358B05A|nr:efflux RND transporter periplasmic adaptor subunit [Desulfovibrio sp. X2]EPR38721.1 efflux transporter, RND family, MFP subunit [Desulfovibrio sp. X2]
MNRKAAYAIRTVALLGAAALLLWALPHMMGAPGGTAGDGKPAAQDAAAGGRQAKGAVGKGKVPVTVATARRSDFPIELKAVGTVEASATVGIKSRVEGELVKVHFVEGQEVKKGDLLFTIDPRPLQASLEQARANLERNKALLTKAEEDYRRYQELERQKIISQEQFEQIFSTLAALKATVRADEATVDNARVQLEYTSIRSPISGRVGRLLSDMGNMIKANADNPMVTIVQMEPVYVTFAVPEERLVDVLKAMRAGPVTVLAQAAEAGVQPEKGALFFVDNQVDRKTGTITLKGEFDNKNRLLWPGRFVTVTLGLGMIKDAVVVPSRAVQTGLDGQYIWTVDANGEAGIRNVTTGRRSDSETVVLSGIEAGDRVIVDGQLRVTPGAPLEILDAPGQSSLASPDGGTLTPAGSPS